MPDAIVKFENEGVEGFVPVGTTLMDAAKRLGIRFDGRCGDEHICTMLITSGIDNIEPSGDPTEHLATAARRSNERLACRTHILKSGEIIIMTEPGKNTDTPKDPWQAEFEALPLDKKISSLFRMEAVTLGETLTYVANSTMKAVEKFGDALTDIGGKIETEAKKAAGATESEPAMEPDKPKAAKPKTGAKKPNGPDTPEAGGI